MSQFNMFARAVIALMLIGPFSISSAHAVGAVRVDCQRRAMMHKVAVGRGPFDDARPRERLAARIESHVRGRERGA